MSQRTCNDFWSVSSGRGGRTPKDAIDAKLQIEASLLPDWDVIGQDCTDDAETCSGNTVCASFGDSSVCTRLHHHLLHGRAMPLWKLRYGLPALTRFSPECPCIRATSR